VAAPNYKRNRRDFSAQRTYEGVLPLRMFKTVATAALLAPNLTVAQSGNM
jgi:hypothetical protein